jgi:hypothetical protein
MANIFNLFGLKRKLVKAIPNENWEITIEFEGNEFRLFKASIARSEKGMSFLAYPQKFKAFTVMPTSIKWASGGELDSEYLYKKSVPIDKEHADKQILQLEYKNQAPTKSHETHHVYGVYLKPYNEFRPFILGESIGGGHGEMGHDEVFSLEEMLKNKNWREHFSLSGCEWAIPIIE